MKRCLDDSGTVETILNTFPSSSLSLSPTRSRSLSAVSNVTYTPQISNNSIQYPVDSTSPVHNFSAIMPTLTVHEKNPNPNVIPVGSSPVHTTIHTTVPIAHSSLPLNRNKVHSAVVSSTAGQTTPQQFQRLKVEDALSYLDLVKFKFGSQPQVYNDFLDIMKEFKSQSIDTPGVITRVSNLFKGHPELIVGFNTFLPPGYKIEVQSSDSGGYSFQVSVSIPSPSSSTSTLVPSTQSILHSTTISNITSTVTTTASTLLPGTTLSVVNPPIAAKPITLPNSNLAPILTTPLTISSGNTVIPVTNSVAPANVPNNVTSNVPTMAAVALTNSSPPQSFTMNPAAHQAVSHALIQVESGGNVSQPIPQNQPVEFNHAINYVNKIKNRFQGQPDKYKRFLEILHTYQKEQRTLKENQLTSGIAGKTLTEAEVYSQVAKLFENQEDLLTEFGQFLPDATSHQTSFITKNNELSFNSRKPSNVKPGSGVGGGGGGGGGATFNNTVLNNNTNSSNVPSKFTNNNVSSTTPAAPGLLKRSASISNSHSSIASMQPAVKKHKSPSSLRDLSVTEATKYGTLNDYAFFDRIRKTIQNPEMYRNFLRCLIIYNNEIVNETELLQLTTPFLTSHPELLRWFKEFLGPTETPATTSNRECRESENKRETQHHSFLDQVHNNVVRSENSVDIDYTMCKRIGASYCAVPDEFNSPKCSGRTDLCREVLNDNWVSFPSWSEDSTFVSSRKTQYEEYIYRCEDERFELDVVIETNAATIKVFEGVQKKMSRLTPEDVAKYYLDDNLGGTSQSIHVRAIKRIYGDKAGDIVEGIKKNPNAAIPVVLRRLKSKEEEWREAQKGFNKIWREQNEKFYLKSLDHQGMNFKQNDMKYLRSKSLITEIETLYDDRQNGSDENNAQSGPHLVLPYRDKSVLDDAANLLIHHVKRQTGIHKEDKQKIKSLIRQFIPDLFYHPRQELSDDEREELEEKSTKEVAEGVEEEEDEVEKMEVSSSVTTKVDSGGNGGGGGGNGDSNSAMDVSVEDIKVPLYAISCHPDEQYTLFFADNHWYLFLRLHQILCDRLSKMYERANIIAKQESSTKDSRTESAAISLRLKPKPEIEIEEYYTAMLDMVKNVLDNNMDSTTYEDTLREMFGIHAYIAFTLDKVVSHAVRQLQYLVSDRACQQCYEMFTKEKVKGATGGLCSTAHQRVNAEANYQKKAETMRMDSCFKIFIYKLDCKITIECLDTEGDNDEDTQENEKWCNFRENDDSNKDKFASEFNENNDKVES